MEGHRPPETKSACHLPVPPPLRRSTLPPQALWLADQLGLPLGPSAAVAAAAARAAADLGIEAAPDSPSDLERQWEQVARHADVVSAYNILQVGAGVRGWGGVGGWVGSEQVARHADVASDVALMWHSALMWRAYPILWCGWTLCPVPSALPGRGSLARPALRVMALRLRRCLLPPLGWESSL